jgi:N-acetylmuramoyl-L-alanine amidase
VPGHYTLSRRRFLSAIAGTIAGFLLPGRSALASRTVTLICRRAWGAEPPTGGFHRHRIRRITVHHSAVVLRDNRKAPERFRDHQAAHQARGWPDIAYHILIDRHGHVYEGRPWWARGDTGTDYSPRGHLLVLCEGNFERQAPSRKQVASLVSVLAWAVRRFDIPVFRIRGHRDFASTACPGRRLYRLLEDGSLHRRVRRRLGAEGVRLDEICGRAGRRLVRDIEAGRA